MPSKQLKWASYKLFNRNLYKLYLFLLQTWANLCLLLSLNQVRLTTSKWLKNNHLANFTKLVNKYWCAFSISSLFVYIKWKVKRDLLDQFVLVYCLITWASVQMNIIVLTSSPMTVKQFFIVYDELKSKLY